MTCCADCKYARYDCILDLIDPDPWVCALTGEHVDPEYQCTHFEEEEN
jgi:hypothetical protein